MADYVLTLRRKNNTRQFGYQEGATFQCKRQHKPAQEVALWSFGTTDTDATVVTALEAAVAARGAVAFAGNR